MPTALHILVYGSLRSTSSRGYNLHRCGHQKSLRTLRLGGYAIHDLGAYPALRHDDDPKSLVTFELHEVSPQTHRAIRNLELGAGYTEETIRVPLTEDSGTSIVEAFVYCWPKARLEGQYEKVEGGDWA